MIRCILKIALCCIIDLFFLSVNSYGQKLFTVGDKTKEHIFSGKEIQWMEDVDGTFTLTEVTSSAFSDRFKDNANYYPRNYHSQSVYWYKVKLRFDRPIQHKESIIEFFDQTTDDITAYIPDSSGHYIATRAGAKFEFERRLFKHKNFEFTIPAQNKGEYTYYFRLKSGVRVNVIIVYRDVGHFIYYALTEYFTFGLFYGMIIIFCFHNLLMFVAVKKLQYLFYVLYIISVGLYQLSIDGIAFQYLWPGLPVLNDYAAGVSLYLLSIFALVFTRELLQLKTRARSLDKVFYLVILLRTGYFLFCLFFYKGLFIYKFIEIIPLSLAFYAGVKMLYDGFKPARFFVLGYTFLFLGFILKGITVLGWTYPVINRLTGHYSLTISFVFEMVFLSFSIGDQVRLLREEKDKQTAININLKDSLNRELEEQVKLRTQEVIEKSNQVEMQAAEIQRMNVLLEKDNVQLKTNIEKVTNDQVLSKELSFEEFSAKYPDQDTCYRFLAELKWANGYTCSRCGNAQYCNSRMPYGRRCTKCAYEESVLKKTIFHNGRLPLTKAFYLVYLMYNSKGTISSYQLAERLEVRQSTCWAHALRVKNAMKELKKNPLKGVKQGWSNLVIEM